jgi:hypothetical protein
MALGVQSGSDCTARHRPASLRLSQIADWGCEADVGCRVWVAGGGGSMARNRSVRGDKGWCPGMIGWPGGAVGAVRMRRRFRCLDYIGREQGLVLAG